MFFTFNSCCWSIISWYIKRFTRFRYRSQTKNNSYRNTKWNSSNKHRKWNRNRNNRFNPNQRITNRKQTKQTNNLVKTTLIVTINTTTNSTILLIQEIQTKEKNQANRVPNRRDRCIQNKLPNQQIQHFNKTNQTKHSKWQLRPSTKTIPRTSTGIQISNHQAKKRQRKTLQQHPTDTQITEKCNQNKLL